MHSLFSGGNRGFVCTQYKVSETKSAAISYLNAAVTLQFLHPVWKVGDAASFGEKKSFCLWCNKTCLLVHCQATSKLNNLKRDVIMKYFSQLKICRG